MRCYYDADYSDGGEPMFQRSNKACERAIELDPNRVVAAGQLIENRVARGELGKAYQAAQTLVKRRPESAEAHFTMGYVYRYAGMLEQSTNECNTALALDPGNYTFRSCAWAFMELVRPIALMILSVWMPVRSGPRMRCHPFFCARGRFRKHARR